MSRIEYLNEDDVKRIERSHWSELSLISFGLKAKEEADKHLERIKQLVDAKLCSPKVLDYLKYTSSNPDPDSVKADIVEWILNTKDPLREILDEEET